MSDRPTPGHEQGLVEALADTRESPAAQPRTWTIYRVWFNLKDGGRAVGEWRIGDPPKPDSAWGEDVELVEVVEASTVDWRARSQGLEEALGGIVDAVLKADAAMAAGDMVDLGPMIDLARLSLAALTGEGER